MPRFYAIYKSDGTLRMTEFRSDYGEETIKSPYIGTNKKSLATWRFEDQGDTIERVRIERERTEAPHD